MSSLQGPAGGETFDPDRDGERLNLQREKVFRVMSDGQWHTLGYLERVTGQPQASISARLRDFRKPKFGGHTVQRTYVRDGLWAYRLQVVN
jgi:hypothetical protein